MGGASVRALVPSDVMGLAFVGAWLEFGKICGPGWSLGDFVFPERARLTA